MWTFVRRTRFGRQDEVGLHGKWHERINHGEGNRLQPVGPRKPMSGPRRGRVRAPRVGRADRSGRHGAAVAVQRMGGGVDSDATK